MKKGRAAGFTLIELMVVVAILGILATLAISSYQRYSIKAQVSEGMNLAGIAKTQIVDFFLVNGEAPVNRSEAGLSAAAEDTLGNFVKSVAIVNGRIDVTFGNSANVIIRDEILRLTPYETEGAVVWRCGNEAEPVASGGGTLSPMGTAGGGNAAVYLATYVANAYLPAVCQP